MEFDSSFFDAGLERRHTDCEKWDGMVDEHHDPEMIPMWVADMDFRSAPAIADAVKRVAEQGTPAELMERGGLYRRMVELQSESAQWRLNGAEA